MADEQKMTMPPERPVEPNLAQIHAACRAMSSEYDILKADDRLELQVDAAEWCLAWQKSGSMVMK